MANKQTRRSYSLSKEIHEAVREHAKEIKISGSEYITNLIRADFAIRGFPLAPARHITSFKSRQPKAEPAQPDKYAEALEFTRRKLEAEKANKPR